MLLHPIGMFLLLKKIKTKEILLSAALLMIFIILDFSSPRYSDFSFETLVSASEARLDNTNVILFSSSFLNLFSYTNNEYGFKSIKSSNFSLLR